MRVSTCLSLCAALLPLFLLAQGGYVNVSAAQGITALNQNPVWGAGASFFDFDDDGWDDLSFPMKNDSIKFYRNNNGTFEAMPSFGPNVGDAKQVCWFDMDNDGDRDAIITYYLAPTLLFRNEGNWVFTDITVEAGIPTHPIAKTFGASCADYDKDGFLDIYLSNYNWITGPSNWLLHNMGDGTFEEVAQDLGVCNGEYPTFQSTWIDYNNDTWPDIYVINDKSPENAMYRNNGDGTFTDVSEETGTDIVVDAMSNAICDYDNNGYLDIYVTNSNTGNVLLKNNGDGTFSDATVDAGLSVFALCWGATWVDHDNDLNDDVMVLTTYAPINHRNYFYENQGDGTFVDYTLEAGLYQDTPLSYSNAKGDFNNDGYFDIAVANSQPDNCYLYENNGGTNNYLKLELEGVVSNRDAVGVWLRYYLEDTKYVEYTTCGENYMSQDSHSEILSMGSFSVIDSLFILWPSGQMEKLTNIEANQTLNILEGSTLQNTMLYDGPTSFCLGDSLVLDAGEFQSYEWANGDTTRYITVVESGQFSVDVTNEFGLVIHSDLVETTVFVPAELTQTVTDVLCNNQATGGIELSTEGGLMIDEITWSSGDTTSVLNELVAGEYIYFALDENGCQLHDTIAIEQPEALCSDETLTSATCYGDSDGSIEVEPCGGVPEYWLEWGDLDPFSLSAGSYSYTLSDENGCSSIFNFEIDEPDELSAIFETNPETKNSSGTASVIISGGTEPYEVTWNIGDHTLIIENLEAGTYTIQITDANGCVLYSECNVDFMISVGEKSQSQFNVYPNPISSIFTIDMLPEASTLRLTDLNGRLVWQAHSLSQPHFNISSLPSGMYILSVHQEENDLFRTVITKQD